MRITANVDTDLISILGLRNELDPVFEILSQKYASVKEPNTVGIALRCLPDHIGRKTFKRYDKKDQYLTIDITVSLEKYSQLTKTEQRHELGIEIYDNLVEALKKYKFPEFSIESFLEQFKTLANRIGWLTTEIDWSKYPD